jgi:hypothetical protein
VGACARLGQRAEDALLHDKCPSGDRGSQTVLSQIVHVSALPGARHRVFRWAEAEGGQGKQPYRLQARTLGEAGAREAGDAEIVALAGLYDVWRGPEGEELYTYIIVTTQAGPRAVRLFPLAQRVGRGLL